MYIYLPSTGDDGNFAIEETAWVGCRVVDMRGDLAYASICRVRHLCFSEEYIGCLEKDGASCPSEPNDKRSPHSDRPIWQASPNVNM